MGGWSGIKRGVLEFFCLQKPIFFTSVTFMIYIRSLQIIGNRFQEIKRILRYCIYQEKL
jgi:hypothetical protein